MTSEEIIFPILILLAIFCFGVYLQVRPYRKAKLQIEKWANENNYMIHRKEKKIGLNTGPFIFGGWTAIYKVSVGDSERIKKNHLDKNWKLLMAFFK
ncbi:MAG: hypothetical protein GY705_29655 [Bacteroidetes bacterium]|nr:hypothetical protein [Bacteroidota bacterium]